MTTEKLKAVLNRAAAWWHGLDEAAADALAAQREEEAAATRRANHDFNRHGPSDRDLLPGGRFERKTGRRPSSWLRRR